jgi:hypothetical protein
LGATPFLQFYYYSKIARMVLGKINLNSNHISSGQGDGFLIRFNETFYFLCRDLEADNAK